MAQSRSTNIISMIKWIQTSRLSINNSLHVLISALFTGIGKFWRKYPHTIGFDLTSQPKERLCYPPTAHLALLCDTFTQNERSSRCRVNAAHVRQTRPDSGVGLIHFQVKDHKTCKLFPPRLAVDELFTDDAYRGTSITRNSKPLGPYSRNMPRALWRP